MNKLTFVPELIIAFILLISGCRHNAEKGNLQKGKADSTAVVILKKENFHKELSFPAELLPLERAEIYAKVTGYVKSINRDIGDPIQKGEIVAVLDAPEMISGYTQIISDVQTAKSKFEGSNDAYQRILSASQVKGTVAEGELERIRSQMLADSASLEAARSRLEGYSRLKDYLVIRAPFKGILTQRNVDQGTLVGTGTAKPLFVIESNNVLRLRIPVPQTYTFANSDSSSVRFKVDAYPDKVFEAGLSRKSGALTPSSRTETWEFLYLNKDNLLKSGMLANATLRFGRISPSFIVLSSAIVTNQERRFVIRLKNGKAEWIDVRNGIAADNRTEIFGNLSEGDTLLVRGTDEIKPGRELIPILLRH